MRSPFLFSIRAFSGVVLALAVIVGTLVHAQESEKEPKKSGNKAREEMKTVSSPTPSEESEPKAKPKPAKRKITSTKKRASKSGTKKTAKKTPTPEPKTNRKDKSGEKNAESEDKSDEEPKKKSKSASNEDEEQESKSEGTKAKAKSKVQESEDETGDEPKPKHPKKTPTPEPKPNRKDKSGDGSAKSKARESSEEEESPAPKSKGSKSGSTKSPTPEPTKRPGASAQGTSRPAKTPPIEKSIVPEPTRAPTPEPATHPTPVPVAPAQQNVLPSDITIEKSGLQKEQRLEPPPPAPVKRGLWPWSRQPSNYRYLTSANIDAIRRAPVQSGRWKFIIVHNSGTRQGNAKAFDYYHRKIRRMKNGLAYHFVIGNGTSSGNGKIEIGDRWVRQIAGGHVHSDYMNNIGLGICLVGDFNRDQPTRAQLDATEELIRYLRERCGKSDGRPLMVRPHREVNPPRWATDCPGDAFPYGWLGKLR